ncbi:hypothetical protein LDENG_00189310 [Lucifuga dentata]|nr:hypothetical protein LDENG_00189310 [Lucifuga dentata]
MINNFLKLNSNKTKLLVIGSKTTLTKMNRFPITINGCRIPNSTQAESLDVILDDILLHCAHLSHCLFLSAKHFQTSCPHTVQHRSPSQCFCYILH